MIKFCFSLSGNPQILIINFDRKKQAPSIFSPRACSLGHCPGLPLSSLLGFYCTKKKKPSLKCNTKKKKKKEGATPSCHSGWDENRAQPRRRRPTHEGSTCIRLFAHRKKRKEESDSGGKTWEKLETKEEKCHLDLEGVHDESFSVLSMATPVDLDQCSASTEVGESCGRETVHTTPRFLCR